MYLPPKDISNTCKINGLGGLPEGYPVPCVRDMLFYIQRNQNENTVIYRVNRNLGGNINLGDPVSVFWKNYYSKLPDSPINYIQRQLAYGTSCRIVNNDMIQLTIVSYPKFPIYIVMKETGVCQAIAKIKGQWAVLTNVYVYAEDSGAFPVVNYLEIYGVDCNSELPCYEKIEI